MVISQQMDWFPLGKPIQLLDVIKIHFIINYSCYNVICVINYVIVVG